ncbi:MAG: DUF3488 and transglutaminase-like domain-containing protein [Bdellovibrio sp.]
MKRNFFSQKTLAIPFLISMAMVGLEVSIGIAIFSFVILFWRWGVETFGWKPLSRRLTGLLSVGLLVQVLIQFRTLIGQEPAYTFMLGLASLRIMDYDNDRDHKFIVLLGFILLSVKSLFSLDIYWIPPTAVAFVCLWHSLLPNVYPEKNKMTWKILLLSVPMALILFMAFPRLVIPWAMSRGGAGSGAEIGFSEEMNPGRIAELAGNPQIAFRAKISDLDLKSSRDLYWRGSLLSYSQGLSWTPGRFPMRSTTNRQQEGTPYEIAMEATSQMFIFVLDGTKDVSLESGAVIPLRGGLFRSARPFNKATVYRGYWNHQISEKDKADEMDLQIPPLTGRVLKYVDELKLKNMRPDEVLQELQRLFSDGSYFYTLSPGVYATNDLETFLFERKRGFCEHFAGAYATLARALGVPARVVTGYQGGRYNPWGDFWKISQRDAHAWVEVYFNHSWHRVDPTTWVAPLRLVIGAEDFFGMSEEDQRAFARSIDWRPRSESVLLVWDRVTFWIENINYQWNYFLIDFDRESQRSFWSALAAYRAESIVALVLIVLLCAFLYRSLFRQRKNLREEEILLAAIEKWAGQLGKPRKEAEGPFSYLSRLEKELPRDEVALRKAKMFYDQKAYANKEGLSGTELLKEWRSK